jgi:hypothetical protein
VSQTAYLAVRTPAARAAVASWRSAVEANGFAGKVLVAGVSVPAGGQRGHPALFLGTRVAIVVATGAMDDADPQSKCCVDSVRATSEGFVIYIIFWCDWISFVSQIEYFN